MFSVKELKIMSSKIEDSLENIRLEISSKINSSSNDDLLPCVHLGEKFVYFTYFSKSNPSFSIKITPYDIIGDDDLIQRDKDYCRYLQIFTIEQTRKHYEIL